MNPVGTAGSRSSQGQNFETVAYSFLISVSVWFRVSFSSSEVLLFHLVILFFFFHFYVSFHIPFGSVTLN